MFPASPVRPFKQWALGYMASPKADGIERAYEYSDIGCPGDACTLDQASRLFPDLPSSGRGMYQDEVLSGVSVVGPSYWGRLIVNVQPFPGASRAVRLP